jgi:beta-glucosidase
MTYPFQNPDLPLNERLDDLASRLSLQEKSLMLLHDAIGINRLGIRPFPWWSECLHGVARNGRATVFPQAIAMAAAFDPTLMTRIGDAISDEARAMYAVSVERSVFTRYAGLTFWTPNINIFRDPRWGRGQETYGEDPWLTSRLGVAFVKSLQGDDPDHLKIAACAKHFAAHSGPEGLRHEFDARVSMRDFRDTYLPAFEALVTEANVEIVMGAYNRTNGDPCCAHPYLMNEVLRGEWGFKGHFVSDCWAIRDFHENHKVTQNAKESAALAIKQGCDVNCGCTYECIDAAVEEGLLTEAEVDVCFKRAMATRFRLGEFDPDERVHWRKIPQSVIRRPEHVQLARESAAMSMVLMKNNGLLPLNRDSLSTVFVTGPHATSLDVLLGNYFGSSTSLVSFLEGITEACPSGINVEYKIGCGATYPNLNPADWVSSVGAAADVCIACLGVSPLHEGEEGDAIESADLGDRPQLGLPPHQIELVRKIRERGNAKIVVVLTGGSPITDAEIFDLADAVVWAWYPGEQGGHALADVLFGDVNPSGRLPISFPRSLDDLPLYEDYSMDNRTYRYMDAEPLFPFGFGLTYTQHRYHSVTLSEDRLTASVEVENTGDREGVEIVQIYARAVDPKHPAPKQSLIGFLRTPLAPGEKKTVDVPLNPKAFTLVDTDGKRVPHEGSWEVIAAGACPIPRSETLGTPAPVRVLV